MALPAPDPARPLVKVCGLRRVGDAVLAMDLGARMLGVVLTTRSPRTATPGEARAIVAEAAPRGVPVLAVFTDEPAPAIAGALAATGCSFAQVHGPVAAVAQAIGAARVVPAVAMRSAESVALVAGADAAHPAIVVDAWSATAHGGTGKTFEHRWVQPLFASRRVLVAGGLNPANIAQVIATLRSGGLPYAFDLSSGVEEAPGVKSADLLRAFFRALVAELDG